MKRSLIRIGRYWIDRALLREGYQIQDIFDDSELSMELPEAFLPVSEQAKICWLKCPGCEEVTPVGRERPTCECCGWSEEELADVIDLPVRIFAGGIKCAA